jgi:hypothetical protein
MSQQRAEQLVEAGLWLKLSGDTDGARRLFEQALRLDPQNARAKQLLDSRPAAPPTEAGPPGTAAPPSNVGGRSLIEQDWAMATGILAERKRGQTPPPVALSRDASVPDGPARPPENPLQSTVPWVADGAPPADTLIWGKGRQEGPPASPPRPPSVPWMTGFTPASGVPPATPTIPWGQATPPEVLAPPSPGAPHPVPPGLMPRGQSAAGLGAQVESAWDASALPPVPVVEAKEMGRAMDLIATPVPTAYTATPPPGAINSKLVGEEVQTLLKGARDLLDLDDHTGAIDLIRKAQDLAPNDPEVARLRDRSELTLQTMFESKLGAMERRPRVVLKDDEIIWLNLDHRAGFVLAQIDGTVSFEDLFAVSGMSRLDTARILAQLIDEGVIKA